VLGVLDRTMDYLAAEPVRVSAVLRLPLIVLIALLVYMQGVAHWMPALYLSLLILYTAGSVLWLFYVLRRPVGVRGLRVSTICDVLAVLAMCLASGGATTWLLPIFFLLPISVAFLDRPELTAILGFSVAIGYLVAWIVYSRRDDRVGLPNEVYVQVGCLVWLTVATTALCYVLARRSARVRSLLEVRRKLVAESMQADERHNRRLSEQLHDGPLQNLLAARLDLEDLRENPSDENFDRVDTALRNTVTLLRTTVTTLHPTVLAQVGLTAAMRDLVRQYEQRWTAVTIDCELDEVGRPESQALLHRAASELLANAYKHSRATRVDIELRHTADAVVLSIADNGVGFDPGVLDSCVAQGHIGLSSLVVGIEEMGGAVELAATAGGGATVTITMPDRFEQH
jgi:two-component system NarL family sensor kinase